MLRDLLTLLSAQTWNDVSLKTKGPDHHRHGTKGRKYGNGHDSKVQPIIGRKEEEEEEAPFNSDALLPTSFMPMARRFLEKVCTDATPEAIRDAVYDQVASPALQVGYCSLAVFPKTED